MKLQLCFGLILLMAQPLLASEETSLKGAIVLIIRHAEKPENGSGLSPAGERRAAGYVDYFKQYTVDSNHLALDWLISSADSKKSRRPRLTLLPLSQATGLAIECRFKNTEFQDLADEVKLHPRGKHILICWHHGEIPHLLAALGADSKQILPDGIWPESVFGWLIQLRYDSEGRLLEAKRINEKLMPGDAEHSSGQVR